MQRLFLFTGWLAFTLMGVLLILNQPYSWRCNTQYPLSSLSLTRDKTTLLANFDFGTILEIWATNRDRPQQRISPPVEITQHGHLLLVLISPNGKHMLTSSTRNIVALSDSHTMRPLYVLKGHVQMPTKAQFSRDGRWLVTFSPSDKVIVWDLTTKPAPRAVQTFITSEWPILSFDFSPDSNHLLLGTFDGKVTLWDLLMNRAEYTISAHNQAVYTVLFTDDGRQQFLTTGLDHVVKLWEMRTGSLIQTFIGHQGIILQASLSRDYGRLLTFSEDRTAKLWDIASGMMLHNFPLTGALAYNATFSPDGRQIITSSMNGDLQIWDSMTGQPLHTLSHRTGSIVYITFLEDGSLLAVDYQGIIMVWDTQHGTLIRPLCPLLLDSVWSYVGWGTGAVALVLAGWGLHAVIKSAQLGNWAQ